VPAQAPTCVAEIGQNHLCTTAIDFRGDGGSGPFLPPLIYSSFSLVAPHPKKTLNRYEQPACSVKMPSLSVSPAARRIIEEAFRDLEQTISQHDKAELAGTTLEKVIHAARAVEDELAARQSLRNMRRLMPLFTGLQYYAKSIDVLCNGTPYLAWIWAPIKLILHVSPITLSRLPGQDIEDSQVQCIPDRIRLRRCL
jgi:hypothetical protein